MQKEPDMYMFLMYYLSCFCLWWCDSLRVVLGTGPGSLGFEFPITGTLQMYIFESLAMKRRNHTHDSRPNINFIVCFHVIARWLKCTYSRPLFASTRVRMSRFVLGIPVSTVVSCAYTLYAMCGASHLASPFTHHPPTHPRSAGVFVWFGCNLHHPKGPMMSVYVRVCVLGTYKCVCWVLCVFTHRRYLCCVSPRHLVFRVQFHKSHDRHHHKSDQQADTTLCNALSIDFLGLRCGRKDTDSCCYCPPQVSDYQFCGQRQGSTREGIPHAGKQKPYKIFRLCGTFKIFRLSSSW